jgi:cytochrome c1
LRDWLEDPQAFNPDTPMPATEGSPEELDQLTDYLMTLKREELP